MRYIYQGTYQAGSGAAIPSGTISVYLAGTTTPANVYAGQTGGASVNSVLSDERGLFVFYVDPKDYAITQQFKIVLSKTDFANQTIDDIDIFHGATERYIVNASETDQGDAGNGNTLNSFIDSIGSAEATIYFPAGAYTLTTSETVPSNITPKFDAGVVIDGAGTLTLNKRPSAGYYKIFGSSVTVSCEWTCPQWWGAGGEGSTDDTDETQAAVDAVELAGGGVVFFPQGTYLLSSTITVDSSGVKLHGESVYNTVITRSTDYGDTFLFTGNDATGTPINDVEFKGFKITSTGLTTSGAHLKMNGVTRSKIENLYILQGFKGFDFLGLTATTINDIYLVFSDFYGGSDTGRAYMSITSASSNYPHPSCGDVFMSNLNLRGNTANQVTANGIQLYSADGIWFSNVHVGNTTTANLSFNHTKDENLSLIYFSNSMFDANTGYNILFQGTTGTGVATDIVFSNCDIKGGSTSTDGVKVGANTSYYGVQFNNCTIWQHSGEGVDIDSTAIDRWFFVGCDVRGNSYGNTGTYAGYDLAAGVSGVSIIGGLAGGDDQTSGVTSEQSYGIRILSGAGNNIIIDGVNLLLNNTGSISNGATGDNVIVKNCIVDDSNSIASATSIALKPAGKLFNITGTTNITNITASWLDREVVLKFAGILTVNDGTGNIQIAGNLVTTAGDTLTLICDGTDWHEVSRSVN